MREKSYARIFGLALACLLLWILGAAHAQDNSEEFLLDPKSAILRGIESNFGLKAEKTFIPQRRQDVVAGEAKFDPSIEAELSAHDRKIPTGVVLYDNQYEETEMIGASAGVEKTFETGLKGGLSFETYRSEDNFLADSIDPEYHNTVILHVTQPILRDFGADINTTEIEAAKNRVEMAFMAYTGAARDLAEQIEYLYYDLSRAEAVLGFQLESVELAKELKAANQERFENGTASITPVTEAKTAVTDRREKTIFAEQELEMASNRLKNLLETGPGDPLFDIEARARTLPLPPASAPCPLFEEALEIALQKRSDLKEMQIALENQDLTIAYLQNQKLPRLDFIASAGLNGLSGENDPVNLFGRTQGSYHDGNYARSFSRMLEADGYQWAAGLRLEYPIGNRAAQSRYVKSKYEKRRLNYLMERLKGQIRTEVRNGIVAVQRSRERVEEAQRFIGLAQETLDQENQLLNEGLSTIFKILSHQEKLVAARIRHANALADFHKSLAGLYRATGENLERRGIFLSSSDTADSD